MFTKNKTKTRTIWDHWTKTRITVSRQRFLKYMIKNF